MTESAKPLFQKHTPDGLVEVLDTPPLRGLYLDGIEQTRIDLDHPELLSSVVHRSLLACLLFIETPKTVLLGGLGGGALARYLHHRQPEMRGDAVEINETIAMLARDYFDFPGQISGQLPDQLPGQHWQLSVTDIRHWHKRAYDLMIIDIAEGERTPDWLSSEQMLSQLQGKLSAQGGLAFDLLVDDAAAFTRALANIRKVFRRQTLCMAVPGHKNIIVFAFNQLPENCSIQELNLRAESLTALWGLEFAVFIKQLQKDNPGNNGVF